MDVASAVSSDFIPDFFKDFGNLYSFLQTAELGVWEVQLDSNIVSWDDRCRELFGIAKGNNISYFDAIQFIHPDDSTEVTKAVDDALNNVHNGKYNVTYRTIGADDGILRWVNFIGKAYFDEEGVAKRFSGIARDVSQAKVNELLRIAQKESEENLKNLFEQAPMAIGVLKTRNMILESGNERIFEIWGRNRSSIGKRLLDILPEIKGQGFIELLQGVYDTGEPFYGYGLNARLDIQGTLRDLSFDFVYAPLRDFNGSVTGIIILALDVTSQLQERKKLEEIQISLRGAVELAELGTWSLDLATGIIDYSDRLRKWFGFTKDEVITLEKSYEAIAIEYRPLVKESMQNTITPGSKAVYNLEYKVDAVHAKRERIIHSQGKAHFDKAGNAYKVTGTARDVTSQKHLQFALEHQVQERTEELAASNEELAATNEELWESNESLMTSNDQLKQYAYVASHDLQEPLRKIRVFTDKLLRQPGQDEESLGILNRINLASERMTLLIRNVLEFSSLLKPEGQKSKIDLNLIFKDVLQDFELLISEKGCTIECNELPSIESSDLQMHQLLQNLLSNALKFTKIGVPPVIKVECTLMSDSTVGNFIASPFATARYYKITFSDNGIGFETQYSERIFEIFKRLHGRDEYTGSGIGLALCKRIVAYHHGSLEVESELGIGTTFTIILPDKQKGKTL